MSAVAWIILGTLVEVGAVPPPAVRYQLRWTRAPGAESCIDAGELADQVATRLGRRVFDGAGAGATVIDAAVRPAPGGWLVTVDVRAAGGEVRGARELEQVGADCRALDRPLALVLALIIDLDLAPRAAAPAPMPPRSPAARWSTEATLAGSAGLGVVPGGGLGARLTVAIDAPGAWPVVLGASWWSAGQRDAPTTGQAVRLRPWQVGVAVCTPPWKRGRARVAGCGGGGVTRIDAVGLGFDRNRPVTATVPVAAVSGRTALDLPGPTFVAVEVGVEVPLTRPRFVFDDGGTMTLHQIAPASLVGALGLGVRF